MRFKKFFEKYNKVFRNKLNKKPKKLSYFSKSISE